MKALAPTSEELARTGLHRAPQLALAASGERTTPPSQSEVRSSEGDEGDDAPETELPVPEGELLGGRYLVERIFAEGGMGIVCLGRHAQLEQPVAIKFLRHALAGKPSVVERFLNEGRALAALRSEHVVRVMDVGQLESGRPYLVMEHLEGVDLGALVDRQGPLSADTAVRYALQVCEPLAEAHALGIVHRDIKPENLFLWSGGPGKDIVKVLDFGLAKQFGGQRKLAMTGPQDSIGSPCYMSPEQITTPQSIDSRTDIWSLGVVLHHFLTDTLPFEGSSIIEVISHVLSAAPKSLHEARSQLDFDPELEAIVARCLEKKPEARYQTMAELADALSAYLARYAVVPLSVPPPPERVHVESAARVFEGDNEKIRIAGVHRRWPGVLLFGVLVAVAGLYQADKTGRIRVRDLTDGRLVPARLSADQPAAPYAGRYLADTGIARGIYAAEPTRDEAGRLSLRAVPEVDVPSADESVATTPMTDAERARKQAAYRDYLRSQGLTPLREVLAPDDTSPTTD
ncbi:MAG TPA: serine/threonine-protein kinase [Polyangiaceae bacterium]|nr:serine/threonine-protein kinase [Polyangiaceae bacterium]